MASLPQEPPLRVGLVQFKPVKGDVEGNLARVRELIRLNAGVVDLLLFPEACLSGYFIEGAVVEAARSAEEVARLLGSPPEGAPEVILGFYERHRRRLYNSAVYFTAGEDRYRALHVHRKMFLPTYGIFDEARFVESGRSVEAFDTPLGRMGMLICEEMWHSLPPSILALDGAELIAVPSASPAREFRSGAGRPGNLIRWDALAGGVAAEHGVFVVVSQLVGSEGGKLFPGGSVAMGPDGEVITRGPLLDEGVTRTALAGSRIERARAETPLLADLSQMLPHLQGSLARATERREGESGDLHRGNGSLAGPAPGDPGPRREAAHGEPGTEERKARRQLAGDEPAADPDPGPRPGDASVLDLDCALVERFLVEFIREELVRRRGFERAVLGVSGGVDSSVVLYLAVRALGAENVFGFKMPYATSSPDSLDHADLVLEATGAHGRIVEVTGALDAYVGLHEPDITPHRRGNLAARLRAVTLFDQAFKLRALPLGTGNKSERLFGYYTWHADDSPPINPLGDLFKTQVWALARHLGVPSEIVEKPASADLIQGIHDEDELGISYHEADVILYWLLRGYSVDELIRYGFDEGKLKLVWRQLNATHWKRELPTVAVLSSSAIGEFYLRPVDY
jgi:NAD+ synthase (glutamine-hydrolysing)